jgi:hypothetical protein
VTRRWSKSGLKTFQGCSWRWYLVKHRGLVADPGSPATALGTAYHTALEWHERGRLQQQRDGADVQLPDLAELQAVGHATLTTELAALPAGALAAHDTNPVQLSADLDAALANWHHELRPRVLPWRVVAVEPYFRVPEYDAELHGYIDVLYYDPDTQEYVVVDHKTAAGWRSWQAGGVGNELEAAVYVHGAQQAPNLPSLHGRRARMEWHVARKAVGSNRTFQATRVIDRAVPDSDLEWVSRVVEQVEATIDEGRFEPNPSWFLCSAKWCPAYTGCQVTGELAPGGRLVATTEPD